ncbi:MAG: tetratricopeptide repeat protein [Myxococcota bacterium]|jgi:predicted Zn-dependent protease|nr:tetratricopeptide repeat protein [Myxococcota bacterium]
MYHLLLFFCVVSTPAPLEKPSETSPEAIFQALIETQRYNEAEAFLSSIDGEPELLRVYESFLVQHRDGIEKARTLLEKTLAEYPQSTVLKGHLAQLYLLEQKPAKAQALLQDLPPETTQQFRFVQVQINIFIQQDPRRALDLLTEHLRNKTYSAEHKRLLHTHLMTALKTLGLEHNALQYFKNLPAKVKTSLIQEPSFPLLLGDIKSSETIPILEALAIEQPKNRNLAQTLGHSYLRQGQYRNALTYFKRAHALGTPLALEIADILEQLKRPQEALFYNMQAKNKDAKLLQRFRIYLSAEQYPRAIALIENLKERHLLDDRTRYQYAYALAKLGNVSQSMAICRQLASSAYRTQAKALENVLLQQHRP